MLLIKNFFWDICSIFFLDSLVFLLNLCFFFFWKCMCYKFYFYIPTLHNNLLFQLVKVIKNHLNFYLRRFIYFFIQIKRFLFNFRLWICFLLQWFPMVATQKRYCQKKKKKIYYRGHKNKTFITDMNHNANLATFILTFCNDFGRYKRPISYCISARNTCPKEPKIERDEMQEKES